MSDTPRTDAKWAYENRPDLDEMYSLSRTLERELAAEKERSERLEKALREYGDHKEGCGKRGFWAGQHQCKCGFWAALGDSNG